MPNEAVLDRGCIGDIAFVPVTAADLPLLRAWMSAPHWRTWWGDPDFELGQIRGMLTGQDTTKPYLFHIDGAPMGYIQVWSIGDNLIEPWITEAPWLLKLPQEAVGVDLSIGPAEQLARGIGSYVLRQFSEQLWMEGHRFIIIDPNPENRRAVRAYEKAGFAAIPELRGCTGDSLIMRFQPHQNETSQ